MLSKRWNRLWRAVAGTAPEPVFSRLSAAYGEPHRFYHNLGHIADCLGWFDRAEEPVSDRQAVELAIWFHDVVYDTRSSDNEEKSAVWAERSLERGGVRSSLVEKVGHLVRLTSHRSFPDDPDTRVLLDVDLAILGSAPARFAYYQRAIREEYRWVPEPLYRSRRTALLRSFLDRPSVYLTLWFRDRLERRARQNLSRAVQDRGR